MKYLVACLSCIGAAGGIVKEEPAKDENGEYAADAVRQNTLWVGFEDRMAWLRDHGSREGTSDHNVEIMGWQEP